MHTGLQTDLARLGGSFSSAHLLQDSFRAAAEDLSRYPELRLRARAAGMEVERVVYRGFQPSKALADTVRMPAARGDPH